MRHDLEAILAELRTDIPGGTIEERVARGEHDDLLRPRLLNSLDEFLEIGGRAELACEGRRQHRHAGLWPEQYLCSLDEPPGVRGHSVNTVVTDADDVHLLRNRLHWTHILWGHRPSMD